MCKSRIKKLVPVIMVAVMVITMGIVQVASLGSTRAELKVGKVFQVDDFWYVITSTDPAEVAVAGLVTDSLATEITIPKEVLDGGKTYSVTSIGEKAFYKSGLTTIVLPQSVKTIGADAFYYCTKLTEVTIENTDAKPSKLETIGESAFAGSGITSIVLPQSVTSIGGNAFMHCKQLTEVTIENTKAPSKLETIGSSAFRNTAITSIVIPRSVKTIGAEAFMYCEQLAEITIENTKAPSKLETIGSSAFSYTAITSIAIPQSVTSIGAGAFQATAITSIVIPQSVTSIGALAFYYCEQLADVTIENTDAKPSKLETIGFRAFAGTGITSIDIPQSVKSIGDEAIAYCSELSTIVFSSATVPTFGEALFSGAEKDISAYVPFAQKTEYKTAFEAGTVLEGYEHTLTVLGYGPLVLPEDALKEAPFNEAGYSQSLAATGGIEGETVTYEISAGSLPTGLSMDANGIITGTPTKVGTATFTVTAKVSNTGATFAYSAEKEYTIKSVDKIPPTFDVKNTEVAIEINGATSEAKFLELVVLTNKDDNSKGEVKIITDFDTVAQNALGEKTVTITATDESGNFSTAKITVKVTDTVKPTFDVKNTEVAIEINGATSEAKFLELVVLTNKDDNSKGEVKIITDFDTVAQNALGEKTVTITATDESGNFSTAKITVKVTDTVKPVLTVKNTEVTIEINGGTSEAKFLELVVLTGKDDNSKGTVTITTNFDTVVKQNALGQTTVTITATDESGNFSTATITVNVTDTTPPVFTIENKEVTIELNGNITEEEFLKLVGVTTTDNSDADVTTRINNAGVTITTDFANVKQNVLGKTTVTITATDESGNFSTATITVNVADTTPPVFTIENAEVTIELNGNITEEEFLKLVGATTTDNSGGAITITTDFANVKQNALGEKVVTITATDESGNVTTTIVTVKVTETPTEPTTEPATEEPTTVTEETTTGTGTDVKTGDTFITPFFFVMALFSAAFILVSRKRKEQLQG